MRKALVAVALAGALCCVCCTHAVAVERYGGLGPRPAPPEILWLGSGVAVDASLQLAHVKPLPRVAITTATAFAVRNVYIKGTGPVFGRTVDSGFLFAVAVALTEILGVGIRGHP